MKIISIIGYSGSGKTHFIEKAIIKLKKKLNYNVGVIKYIHEHRIDEEGKDSYKFSEVGALVSIIKNKFGENALFINKEINIEDLILWLNESPFKIDILFFESFRNLPYPTVLCVKELTDVKSQLNENVKVISGLIAFSEFLTDNEFTLPIIDIEADFELFIEKFGLG